jgi:hypothetical protein
LYKKVVQERNDLLMEYQTIYLKGFEAEAKLLQGHFEASDFVACLLR